MGKIETKKENKRKDLLNAAFDLFIANGFHNTSIADIVQKAGIAKGTFYLYFKDKTDIRNRLISSKATLLFQNAWIKLNQTPLTQLEGFDHLEPSETAGSSLAVCMQLLFRQKQIYTDVQACLDQGMAVWEIFRQELGEKSCLLPGCSLRMALYYVNRQEPVMGITDTGEAVLIVGYDAQNIIYCEAGQTTLKRAGMIDSTEMFERAGNLFFTCLP